MQMTRKLLFTLSSLWCVRICLCEEIGPRHLLRIEFPNCQPSLHLLTSSMTVDRRNPYEFQQRFHFEFYIVSSWSREFRVACDILSHY